MLQSQRIKRLCEQPNGMKDMVGEFVTHIDSLIHDIQKYYDDSKLLTWNINTLEQAVNLLYLHTEENCENSRIKHKDCRKSTTLTKTGKSYLHKIKKYARISAVVYRRHSLLVHTNILCIRVFNLVVSSIGERVNYNDELDACYRNFDTNDFDTNEDVYYNILKRTFNRWNAPFVTLYKCLEKLENKAEAQDSIFCQFTVHLLKFVLDLFKDPNILYLNIFAPPDSYKLLQHFNEVFQETTTKINELKIRVQEHIMTMENFKKDHKKDIIDSYFFGMTQVEEFYSKTTFLSFCRQVYRLSRLKTMLEQMLDPQEKINHFSLIKNDEENIAAINCLETTLLFTRDLCQKCLNLESFDSYEMKLWKVTTFSPCISLYHFDWMNILYAVDSMQNVDRRDKHDILTIVKDVFCTLDFTFFQEELLYEASCKITRTYLDTNPRDKVPLTEIMEKCNETLSKLFFSISKVDFKPNLPTKKLSAVFCVLRQRFEACKNLIESLSVLTIDEKSKIRQLIWTNDLNIDTSASETNTNALMNVKIDFATQVRMLNYNLQTMEYELFIYKCEMNLIFFTVSMFLSFTNLDSCKMDIMIMSVRLKDTIDVIEKYFEQFDQISNIKIYWLNNFLASQILQKFDTFKDFNEKYDSAKRFFARFRMIETSEISNAWKNFGPTSSVQVYESSKASGSYDSSWSNCFGLWMKPIDRCNTVVNRDFRKLHQMCFANVQVYDFDLLYHMYGSSVDAYFGFLNKDSNILTNELFRMILFMGFRFHSNRHILYLSSFSRVQEKYPAEVKQRWIKYNLWKNVVFFLEFFASRILYPLLNSSRKVCCEYFYVLSVCVLCIVYIF